MYLNFSHFADFCIHRSVLPLHARVLRNEFWICQISGEACINPIPHWDLSIPRGQYNLFLTAIQFHVYRNTVKTTGETFGRPAPIHGKNTYVLIHGFKETSLTPWYQKMISYGGTVISIDWSAEFTEDYETTAAKIRIIGSCLFYSSFLSENNYFCVFRIENILRYSISLRR